MNDFQEMIREAFVGEEPYVPGQDRAMIQASIRKFEGQDRMVRWLLWFSVLLMTGIFIWSTLRFYAAEPDATPKQLILDAILILSSMQCIGWAKMFIFSNQKNVSILKELKRTQLMLLEEE